MNNNTTTEVKTRTPSMKWVKLDGLRDPAFEKQYFLFSENPITDEGKEEFGVGYLDRVIETNEEVTYEWRVDGYDKPLDHFTHYCIPVAPKV